MRRTRPNTVRIIGGVWRSRLIEFPDAADLRPTPDRVRETLFNWLGQDLSGMACLDLFAGSGALGFEALSRGAASVIMVEKNSAALRALRDNAQKLGATGLTVVRGDALEFRRTGWGCRSRRSLRCAGCSPQEGGYTWRATPPSSRLGAGPFSGAPARETCIFIFW